MQITATQLKQQTHLLDRAVVEDIQVTKRNRPFVVIVDAKRYEELIANQEVRRHTITQADTINEPPLHYQKLDPEKHYYRLEPNTTATEFTNPFADVDDAAAFARELRESAQR